VGPGESCCDDAGRLTDDCEDRGWYAVTRRVFMSQGAARAYALGVLNDATADTFPVGERGAGGMHSDGQRRHAELAEGIVRLGPGGATRGRALPGGLVLTVGQVPWRALGAAWFPGGYPSNPDYAARVVAVFNDGPRATDPLLELTVEIDNAAVEGDD